MDGSLLVQTFLVNCPQSPVLTPQVLVALLRMHWRQSGFPSAACAEPQLLETVPEEVTTSTTSTGAFFTLYSSRSGDRAVFVPSEKLRAWIASEHHHFLPLAADTFASPRQCQDALMVWAYETLECDDGFREASFQYRDHKATLSVIHQGRAYEFLAFPLCE